MTDEPDAPPAGLRCHTPDCPGSAFSVVRTEKKDGYIRRIRRCLRCGRLKVTTEREAGADAKQLPLSFYFQPKEDGP